MTLHEFTIILEGIREIDDSIASRLYEAGCDDGSLGARNGMVSVGFDRRAESLEEAILSAIRDIRKAGLQVQRVEIDAATRINQQLQTV